MVNRNELESWAKARASARASARAIERERARASHKNDINGLWIIGIDYDNRVTTNLNGYLNGHRYLKITRKIHSIHSALLNIVEISMGKSFVFAIGPHAILAEFPDF